MSKVRSAGLGLFVLVAAIATIGVGTAAAQTTVGQLPPDLALVIGPCSSDNGYNEAQRSVSSGASYTVPAAGALTSWSTYPKDGGSIGLAVYRPVAGQYLVLATNGPWPVTAGVVNTFAVAIPVQPGDLIGTAVPPQNGSSCLFETESAGDEIMFQSGNAPVGANLAFADGEPNLRVNISATLLQPPAITSLSPATGSIKGEKVTIAGSNFASITGVAFGGMPATSFTADSEGQITATAPASKALAKVPVTVTTVAGTATSPTTYSYEGCKVPKLIGKKLKASRKKAGKAGCKIGKVTKKDGATGKTGKVTKQNPKAGKVLAPGTKIKVTLKP